MIAARRSCCEICGSAERNGHNHEKENPAYCIVLCAFAVRLHGDCGVLQRDFFKRDVLCGGFIQSGVLQGSFLRTSVVCAGLFGSSFFRAGVFGSGFLGSAGIVFRSGVFQCTRVFCGAGFFRGCFFKTRSHGHSGNDRRRTLQQQYQRCVFELCADLR